MVDKAGGYFRCPFKGYQGVTQGDLLSPTIFNVVVDAVICCSKKLHLQSYLEMI